MPELSFKGKEFVHNHHLCVPYRPLLPDAAKSVGQARMDGNLIIQGDNLHALKALLPTHAGKVDCVFIDPPYNTGNENWSYNDNVNSPLMREWLDGNPVNKEDMLRHDKWLCMMYPRLVLLRELMAENATIWMTLDDNEVHRARAIMDEIFGDGNFAGTCIWHKMDSPKNTAQGFSVDHDYVLVYAKDLDSFAYNMLPRTESMLARYKNPDNDPRGPWLLSDLDARNQYSKGIYSITTPSGKVISGPPRGKYWRVSKEKFDEMNAGNRIWWGEDGNSQPNIKRFLSEVREGVVPQTLWKWEDVGSTRNAKLEILKIMTGEEDHDIFITPKPSGLIERVLSIATKPDSIILDSFAGSGTTAHAVLAANARDNGSRSFILVECEDYADTLTAERVRRVIGGYPFTGTQKETLFKEKLTYSALEKSADLLRKASGIEAMHSGRFDKITKKVTDGVLTVTGERNVKSAAPGLGGSFTYCTLGDPLNLDKLLTGESLPSYAAIGAWLFHTATSQALDPSGVDEENWYLGASSGHHVWLIYAPDLAFLKSNDSALTLDRAKGFSFDKPDKPHLVFAPSRFVSTRDLKDLRVEFSPLPYALYRLERA